ncbi:MAG TPA: agmatine deiminase family protein [Bacteroidales bacterium]|nr:agmatine deiminase family protein [Bacteroidales bacterium]
MVPDKDTNFVYLSSILKNDPRYSDVCARLKRILHDNSVDFGFLDQTKDIWARDYMPQQVDTKTFIRFRYEPSYLRYNPELQTDPEVVCKINKIKSRPCGINLDGGNVVKWYDKALISRRVISENHPYDEALLLKELESVLNTRIILVPDLKPSTDFTGHADGYVRFYNGNTVLVNDLEKEYKYWTDGFRNVMKKAGLNYIEIPWFEYNEKGYPDSAVGIYINFLEVGDLIILPVFETRNNKDIEVFDLFQKLYPQKKIRTLNINPVAREGGLLNCMTWNIKK